MSAWLILPFIFLLTTVASARDLHFSTTEGAWLSLDLSPNGQTIVFDLLGDLYTLPIAGGRATPLLTGPAFESQPRFSPDGARIAFTSDRDGSLNLWAAQASGASPRQLSHLRNANLFSPAWTRDGKAVLVSVVSPSRQGSAELWRFPLDGAPAERLKAITAGPALLVSAPPAGVFGAMATPDGAGVYFANVVPRIYNSRGGAASEIVRRNLQTGQEEVFTSKREIAFKPVPSPDGRFLAFAAHHDEDAGLRIRDLATQRDRWLKYPIQRDELEARATRDVLPNYCFTPDSSAILIAYNGQIHRLNLSSGADTLIPFRADVSLTVEDRLDFPQRIDESPVHPRIAQRPALSPDGRSVAFSAAGHLYLAGSDGKNARTTTSGFHPAWSPDSQQLAYVTWDKTGGQVRTLTGPLTNEPAYYHDPAWAPDGRSVIALRASLRDRRLNVIPLREDIVRIENASVTVIAAAGGLAAPHFSGGRLFLSSPQEGLVSMRPDGTDRRTHFRIPGAQEIRISPDGRQAAAKWNDHLYLFETPSTPAFDLAQARRLDLYGADTFAWSGQTLTWALGASLFQPGKPETKLDVQLPRRAASASLVLRGAKIITMVGNQVIPRGDLVIRKNRIAGLGATGSVAIPPGARIVDVTGQTVMPGFIDVHAHFEIPRSVPDLNTWEFSAQLAYGVTTVRDPQSTTNDIFVYSDLVETGAMPGPRIFSTGPGVFEQNKFSSYEEVLQTVTRYKMYYRTHLLKSYMVGDRQVRQWIVRACRELRVMPTTEGGGDFALNLTHAMDGFSGNEHALPTVPLSNDVAQLYAQTGIAYTPTLIVAFGGPFAIFDFFARENPAEDPKLNRWIPREILYPKVTSRVLWFPPKAYIYPQIAEGAAKIRAAGGNVAMGGHGELQGLQCHWETWALARGMSNHEALRAATAGGAAALGLSQDLGTLQTGKLADLLVLERDPLTNIRNTNTIRYIVKDGEVLDAQTLTPTASRKPNPAPGPSSNETQRRRTSAPNRMP